MSNTIWSSINPATTSGTQLATILDDFKDAVMSGMTGTSRPTQTTAGGAWIDTTNEGSPNFYWSYKVYDGTTDIEIFRINLATGTASITGADSSFQIQKISADAVGPLAKFVKQRIATNGQVLTSDVIGEMRFVGRASDSSNPVVASIRVIAGENETSVASGGYIVFESTLNGAIAATEWMRLHEGKLGVGTQAPETSVHVVGTTGIKTVRASDDATGTIVALEKARIAGTGAVQTSDVIGNIDARAWDSGGAPAITGKLEFKATEGHTAGAKGTQASIKVAKIGASTLTEQFIVGDKIESVALHLFNAQELSGQNVATTATINQLSATKVLVEFTGSTATSVRGINSSSTTKVIRLHNRSSAEVTIEHEHASATAADRITIYGGGAITIAAQGSMELYYCVADSRWKIVSAFPQNTFLAPSVTSYTSGSGTYTTPAGAKWLRIKIVGQGGGGGGSSTQAAGDGGVGAAGDPSTFGTSLITANGGNGGGAAGAAGGVGASAGTVNSPAIAIINAIGGGGGSSFVMASGATNACSGHGGNSALGGGAPSQYSNTGTAGAANTGGGGSGANINTGGAVIAGAGGGSGNFIEAIIPSPAASYSYSVGTAAGGGGSAGTSGSAGGPGGSGFIVVEAHYNY